MKNQELSTSTLADISEGTQQLEEEMYVETLKDQIMAKAYSRGQLEKDIEEGKEKIWRKIVNANYNGQKEVIFKYSFNRKAFSVLQNYYYELGINLTYSLDNESDSNKGLYEYVLGLLKVSWNEINAQHKTLVQYKQALKTLLNENYSIISNIWRNIAYYNVLKEKKAIIVLQENDCPSNIQEFLKEYFGDYGIDIEVYCKSNKRIQITCSWDTIVFIEKTESEYIKADLFFKQQLLRAKLAIWRYIVFEKVIYETNDEFVAKENYPIYLAKLIEEYFIKYKVCIEHYITKNGTVGVNISFSEDFVLPIDSDELCSDVYSNLKITRKKIWIKLFGCSLALVPINANSLEAKYLRKYFEKYSIVLNDNGKRLNVPCINVTSEIRRLFDIEQVMLNPNNMESYQLVYQEFKEVLLKNANLSQSIRYEPNDKIKQCIQNQDIRECLEIAFAIEGIRVEFIKGGNIISFYW